MPSVGRGENRIDSHLCSGPRTWVLSGEEGEENSQLYAVAEALGWPWEEKRIAARAPHGVGKPRVEASMHWVELDRSDPLEPPWPELVLTAGHRPAMVAEWIRSQSKGRARLILLGKPPGPAEAYDLIVVSAEVQIPDLANVLHISLPLMRANAAQVARAVEAWRGRLSVLPHPLIGVLVGGPTDEMLFGASVSHRLLDLAAEIARELGGTPYFITSRRTPPELAALLRSRLPPAARLFEWAAGAAEDPYLALLGLADGFVVTADRISMIVEVVRTGAPLAILPLPLGGSGALDQVRRALSRRLFAPGRNPSAAHLLRRRLGLILYRSGLLTHTRDFLAFQQMLFDLGLAVPLGQGFPMPRGQVPDELPRVVERIRELVESPSGA